MEERVKRFIEFYEVMMGLGAKNTPPRETEAYNLVKDLCTKIAPLSEITIGKYIISRFMNHKGELAIYISDRGGEGMETSIKELEEVLDKFYKEKF